MIHSSVWVGFLSRGNFIREWQSGTPRAVWNIHTITKKHCPTSYNKNKKNKHIFIMVLPIIFYFNWNTHLEVKLICLLRFRKCILWKIIFSLWSLLDECFFSFVYNIEILGLLGLAPILTTTTTKIIIVIKKRGMKDDGQLVKRTAFSSVWCSRAGKRCTKLSVFICKCAMQMQCFIFKLYEEDCV